MPNKTQKETSVTDKPKMNLGSTLVSSLVVMGICSVGIWVLNNLLMAEISGLREELSKVAGRLRESDDRLSSITSQQNKYDRSLQSLGSAERDIGKLRERVASLAEDLNKFHSKIASIDNANSKVKAVEEKLLVFSGGIKGFHSRLAAVDESVGNLEKCLHCPCDFDRIVDSCYFVQRNFLNVDVEEAAKICASKNASLVSIESIGEFQAIREFLVRIYNSQLYKHDHGWLTSGRRVDGELQWTTTGKPVTTETVVWGANEPSNEECVTFFPALGRNMNLADISCGKINRQFICEL